MTFSRRNAKIIVAVWLAVVVAAGLTAALRFRIDNSVSVWFGANDPALVTWQEAVQDFGGREWLLVVLDQADAPVEVASRDRDTLAAAVRRLPHVGMVVSTAQAADSSALARTLLRPDTASGHQALLVQVANDLERQDSYREALLYEIRTLGAGLPTVRALHIAGTPAINGELNRAARQDMLRFFPAVVVLLALAGALVYRNTRDTVALMATALGTVTIAAGALAAAGHPLNMVTIMLPTILIALSVADAVHLIHAFHHSATIREAVRAVWKPSLGTTATTVAGFLAFAGSDVLPIRQLAVFGAFGIAVALLLTFTLTPALLAILWHDTVRTPVTSRNAWAGNWFATLERAPRAVVATFALLGGLLAGLFTLTADTDYAAFFRNGTTVPTDYVAMRQAGFPVNAVNVIVALPQGPISGGSDIGIAVERFAEAIGAVPGVGAVLSPAVLQVLGGDASELVEAGMVSADGSQLQLTAMVHGTSSRDVLAVARAIDALADELLPAGMTAATTGTPLLWARMDAGVIQTQRQSLLAVVVVCLVLLTWLFRSPRLALFGLAVSLYPVALVLGLMGLLEIPLNLATVLIAGIAVGIAVDDTIHFVHAWQVARQAGADPHEAARSASAWVGGRMLATSIILVGAFLVMGTSAFLPTAQFGLFSSLTILLALAADLALVPVLLAWGGRARRLA